MTWPFALELVIPHFVEATGAVEQEAEGMFSDGVIVETGTGADCDFGGVEAGVEDVVGTGGEGLDPAEVLHVCGGVFEVVGGVCPCDEELGVEEVVGDGLGDVVGVEGDGEAVDAGDVEFERGWVEELHGGGGGGGFRRGVWSVEGVRF